MKIEQLYDILNQFPDNKICKNGFSNPHSYRGYYNEASVEPANNVSIADMKHTVDQLLSETFIGYKGGEYQYDCDTEVHLSFEGCTTNDQFDPYDLITSN